MQVNATLENLLARHMAATGWGRHGALSSEHLGLNRTTWRVGDDLWLTRIDEERADLFRRESGLLTALRPACSGAGLTIETPRVVRTLDGNDLVTHAGRAYRATAHIGGTRPDDNRVDTFVAASRTLRDVHAMLRSVPPGLAVLEPDFAQIARVLDRSLAGDWDPVTSDPSERAVVGRVAEWMAPRASRLAEVPQQLVHGDWSTPNLLFDVSAHAPGGSARLAAVRDRSRDLRHRAGRRERAHVVGARDRARGRRDLRRVRGKCRPPSVGTRPRVVPVAELLVAA